MKRLLFAACLAAFGCTGGSSTQVVTGTVSTASSAVAVRAVDGNDVVTASRVRSDGSFTLSLPAGKQYRLEVMTSAGAIVPIGDKNAAVSFKVCEPQDPWDMGGVGTGAGMCQPPPPVACDPADPNCKMPPPPPPDPNCPPIPPPGCDPADPMTCKSPPPPCDPATDPNCTMPCDPASDPNCKPPPPPPCDSTTDPNCMPPPGCDPADPTTCKPPPCDPSTDPTCQLPPPPCADPNDPDTCKDPCMVDPSQCACGPSMDPVAGSGTTGGGTCWPPPLPPGDCDGTMAPAHPPGDFGCGGSTGS